jgi:hypothetical protein
MINKTKKKKKIKISRVQKSRKKIILTHPVLRPLTFSSILAGQLQHETDLKASLDSTMCHIIPMGRFLAVPSH